MDQLDAGLDVRWKLMLSPHLIRINEILGRRFNMGFKVQGRVIRPDRFWQILGEFGGDIRNILHAVGAAEQDAGPWAQAIGGQMPSTKDHQKKAKG